MIFKLTLHFYRELLKMNVIISIFMGIMSLGFGVYGFSICFLTGGYIISLGYFEVSRPNQYYFYYNQGLSKLRLYIVSYLYNAVFGVSSILIAYLCKICWKSIV